MARGRCTAERAAILEEALRKHAAMKTRPLARLLVRQFPEEFATFDSAYHAVRYRRGAEGVAHRGAPGNQFTTPHSTTSTPTMTTRVDGEKMTAEGISPERITSLDKLLAFFQVDRGEWVVDRWECTSWEAMHKDDADEAVVTPLYRVRAQFKRCQPLQDAKREVEGFKEALRTIAPAPLPRPRRCGAGVLLELAIPDLHHGKRAWSEETGAQDWDSSISERAFLDAVGGLVAGAAGLKVERVLLPIGNDLLNVDNHNNTTTSGTPQDEDGRWQKSFVSARRMVAQAIVSLAEIAPVDVLIVAGNHDEERIFYLGDALECLFHRQKHIHVQNAAALRKYYRWGNVLLGFTHGKYEKHAELPNIMALERAGDWATATTREWHLGHLHHLRNRIFEPDVDSRGVMIRFLPSLCPPDAWHAKSGHISAQRQALGMAYDRAGLLRLWPWRREQ